MEWRLSEEQVSYQETLRDWLSAVAPVESVRGWIEAADPAPFVERLAADGWLGVGVDEELGGQGGGVVELALTAEELGRAAAPSAAWLATVLAVPGLAGFPDRTTAWLAPAEDAPDAATGVRVDGDGRLSGTVPRVLAGDEAAAYVVAVGAPGDRALRLVERAAPGVEVAPRRLLDGTRTVADVHLDAARSAPLDPDAAAAVRRATDLAAVLVAADALGAMERMLEMAVAYSLQRRQFGVPIGSFQAVKHAAAGIEVAVEASRSALYFAAASVEAGLEECSLHAAAVKAQVTAEASRAADTALTMHGAIGYTWEHDLHLFYKRARLDRSLFGEPTAWNERIADGLALV
ncbi:acyl-CoA dehydrogenase family protein [Nocardioides mangrovi]|uniref:Acyl-CoA/acyl-ACP dehydrogenase n=1 Tax=Nocardioides mangrovi TaxID=2874580 RepID=A0ABS7UBY9_9ACTN|nr:acyl-CoA dehydrogenase family protein [Nocardioides mangrovi]MBZ5738390.1 acyl-CoA/acyl-ACP dehydrogenase [Nocardioides mangrovi]